MVETSRNGEAPQYSIGRTFATFAQSFAEPTTEPAKPSGY
jgi:hypothetical protein